MSALSGTSIKVLNLSSNFSISSSGWQTLFNQLSLSSIVRLDLHYNYIDNDSLAALANIGTLRSVDLSYNLEITSSRWQSFFNTLAIRGTQLVKLNCSFNDIGNEDVTALGRLLSNMISLKTLDMNGMSQITSQGWVSLFTTLQDSNLDLTRLTLNKNSINDDGMHSLASSVSRMDTLKYLELNENRSVTPAGWQALTGYFRSPSFALEELRLDKNNLNDDIVIPLTSALEHNKTLKWLSAFTSEITDIGWEAVTAILSSLLCNKTSILDTYNSNHMLEVVDFLGCFPDGVELYMDLNHNKDKAEVARQKILQTHFSSGEDDTSNMQELLGMELEMMPAAISWIGRPLPTIGWIRKKVSGLSLLYNLMRRMPDLFDSSAQAKPSAVKRKRDNSPDI